MLEAIGIAKLLLKVFDGLIDLFPTYEERRRNTYNELKGELNAQINANLVDCAAVDDILDRLMQFVGSETEFILTANRDAGNKR